MIDLTTEPCPVCGATNSRIVQRLRFPEHGYAGEFVLRRCDGCALLFNSPRLEPDDLSALYGRNYYFFLRDDRSELRRIVAMHRRTVAVAEEKITGRTALDIGCGRGYFPLLLNRLGWDTAGVELSPEAAEYAKTYFGLKVFNGTAEQLAASSEAKPRALVTAIDVIEHVPSPDTFVAALSKLVEPGGILIIDTPNGEAANIGSKGDGWIGFNPFHIYLFSVENLAILLQKHGFSVEKSFSYHNAPATPTMRDRLIKGLRNVGLLDKVAKAFFGIKKLTLRANKELETDLTQAADKAGNQPGYFSTPDASLPLAAEKRGDNIVVIARRN